MAITEEADIERLEVDTVAAGKSTTIEQQKAMVIDTANPTEPDHQMLYKRDGYDAAGPEDKDDFIVLFAAKGSPTEHRDVTVLSAAGVGTRNAGFNAAGKLVELEIPVDESVPIPGVKENKDHVTKINDTSFSITAGSADIRKADLSTHSVSWPDVAGVNITINNGELRWIAYKWNAGETAIELALLPTMPTTLDEFEQYALIGRVWKEAGVLQVSGRHILLAQDPYAARNSEWLAPAKNKSVGLTYSMVASSLGYLAFTSGEVSRWPVVEADTYHHTWEFPDDTKVTKMWAHRQGQTGFEVLSDNAAGDSTDIRTIADYYDNAGTVTPLSNNSKWAAHLVGVFAGSNEVVFIRGQYEYDSLAEARNGIQTDALNISPWAADLGQIADVSWVLLKSGARDFSDPVQADFIPFTGGGGGGISSNLFALGPFVFSRAGFDSGNYLDGDVDLPFVDWPEDGATQTFGDNYGIVTTVDSVLTVVTFQFANITGSDALAPYIKVNGVREAITGPTLSATNLVQTYQINRALLSGDKAIFGFDRVSGAGGISVIGPTASGYIRTAGA